MTVMKPFGIYCKSPEKIEKSVGKQGLFRKSGLMSYVPSILGQLIKGYNLRDYTRVGYYQGAKMWILASPSPP